MADSSKDIQLHELKDMINDLKKMIKTLGRKAALRNIHGYCTGGKVVWNRKKIG